MQSYDAWKSDDTSTPVEPAPDEDTPACSTDGKRRLRVITNSELKTARRCSQEHYLAYVLGYRPVEQAEPLYDGTIVHLALAAWWLTPDNRLGAALEALAVVPDEYKHAKFAVMIQGYHERWVYDVENYEVLEVEREFRAALINPETDARSRTFVLGGKLDVLVRDKRNGLIKLIEHKTTSEEIGPGSTYWKRLTLDSQISIYHDGAEALGWPVDECLYDVLYKPQQRPSQIPLLDELGSKIVLDANGVRVRTKTGKWRETASLADGFVLQTRTETPAEYAARILELIVAEPEKFYQRGVVVRLSDEMIDARFDTWQQARLVAEATTLHRHPRNPDACLRFSRECDYFGYCTGTESLEDKSKFVQVDNVHQELSEVA